MNSVFEIFPLFIPEVSAGLTSYIVQIIPRNKYQKQKRDVSGEKSMTNTYG
jgi:hypothetical protein